MPTRQDFEMALGLAEEAFRRQDPFEQARKAGVRWVPQPGEKASSGRAEVPFLGTVYTVRGPGGKVGYQGEESSSREPALWESILILHYFNTADGKPLVNEHISFKEIPDGRLYQPNFEKRAVAPLLAAFGKDPAGIVECSKPLGARTAALGDVSITVPVFPRVPVTLVFWRGDAEFPARLTILFDKSIPDYLPTEDMVLSSQMLAFRLAGLAKGKC
ncbi:MAG: DUF3786 domain-containing protein [bacterium]